MTVVGLASGVREGTQKLGNFFFCGSPAGFDVDEEDDADEEVDKDTPVLVAATCM